MATYIINKGYENEETVEAESYMHLGEFFDFMDAKDKTVLTYRAAMVHTVHRVDDSKPASK